MSGNHKCHDNPSVKLKYFSLAQSGGPGVTPLAWLQTQRKENSSTILWSLSHWDILSIFVVFFHFRNWPQIVPHQFFSVPLSHFKKSGGIVAAEIGYFRGGERPVGFPSAFIWPSQLSGFFCLWLYTHLRGFDTTFPSYSLGETLTQLHCSQCHEAINKLYGECDCGRVTAFLVWLHCEYFILTLVGGVKT